MYIYIYKIYYNINNCIILYNHLMIKLHSGASEFYVSIYILIYFFTVRRYQFVRYLVLARSDVFYYSVGNSRS